MWQVGRRLLSRAAVAWVASAGILGGAQTGTAGESLKAAETKSLSKLEGRVVHAFTGEPLRRARVTLHHASRDPISLVFITGRDGRFAFENLEPGTYSLSAERDGFLGQSYGARETGGRGVPITVSAGMHLRDLELKLTPHGVISGRVVDDEGEPVPRAAVEVLRAGTGWSGPHEYTNDLGEFRIAGLAPGRYRLRANPNLKLFGGRMVLSQKPEARPPELLATYYPSTTDPALAGTVEVAAGQEVAGITIQLRSGRLYKIEGVVLGVSPEHPAESLEVGLLPQVREGGFTSLPEARVEPTGEFRLAGVPPGAYYITVGLRHRRPRLLGKTPVEVMDADLEGVVLSIEPPLTVSGVVRVEGGKQKDLAPTHVWLRQVDGLWYGQEPAEVLPDGTFRIQGLLRDKYTVDFSVARSGSYLKALRVGGRELPGWELDLTNAESGVQIELLMGVGTASIEGVATEEDRPAAGARVMAVPDDARPGRTHRRHTTVADQNGQFQLGFLPPGRYKVYAFDRDTLVPDPEQLRPFEGKAAAVTLEEGEHKSVRLAVLPAAELDR